MVFGRIFGKTQMERFECVFEDCKSLCCRNNIVVLNEDDVKSLSEAGVKVDDVTYKLQLNEFLKILGKTSIKQLDGLDVLAIKKDEAGNCVFLSKERSVCEIYNLRPYYCREFPFKFAGGKIKNIDPLCPGANIGEEKEVKEIRKALGLEGLEIKPPYLLGDEEKLKMSRTLMAAIFRLLR
jgi:Fe-S-cluster containining protein